MTARALFGVLFLAGAAQVTHAEVLAAFEFTDNSLAATDADAGDGVTVSALGVGVYSIGELFSPGDSSTNTTAVATQDFMSLSRAEVGSGSTSTQLANGRYFSFTVTNNSGDVLNLTDLTVDLTNNGVPSDRYHNSRIFNTDSPASVTGDTIAKIGKNNGSSGVVETGVLNQTVADGSAITLYIPWVASTNSSGSTSQSLDYDNLTINGTIGALPPVTQDLPNILCLSTEDMSPMLGCYGDTFVNTPNIDALAARGMKYNNVWSNSPACSPARTTLITGMYATTTGGTYHRYVGGAQSPSFLNYYSKLMQDLGYYTTNNSKEDYNTSTPSAGKGWNASSGSAGWTNRPTNTTPFLAIYNYFETHESRFNNAQSGSVPQKDPNLVPLPPHHPDIPVVRNQWAKHYQTIETLDTWVQTRLDRLEDPNNDGDTSDSVAGDTIVIFYSDHGTCAPGGKRYAGNIGQRIPLIVYFPPNWEHLAPPGYTNSTPTTVESSDELVAFVDFAPTLLSIAGEEKESWHHGRAFAGEHYEAPPANDYLYGYTDRMGERTWLTRSVFDGRYVYIRNYRPDQAHLARTGYQDNETFAGDLEELFQTGDLGPGPAKIWTPQGPEELYDLDADPYEQVNLVDDPAQLAKLNELRAAHVSWRDSYKDLAFLTEGVMHERRRDFSLAPYDLLQNATHYPANLIDTADKASMLDPADIPTLVTRLGDPHESVRHWALIGLMLQGRDTVRANESAIANLLATDPSYWVKVTAAQVLATHGTEDGTTDNQTAGLDHLFAVADDSRYANNQIGSNWFAEREIIFALHALDQVPYIPASYEPQLDNLEDGTTWTNNFQKFIDRYFYSQYNNPLASFRHQHGLNRFGLDDFGNPSGDGIPNLLKFAFNLAPNEGDLELQNMSYLAPGGTAGLPALTDEGDGTFTYRYLRRIPVGDSSESGVFPTTNVDYTVRSSTNLIDWPAFAPAPATEPIDTEWERVIHTFPSNGSKEFFRVEVQP